MTLTCSASSECFCINSDLLFISSEHLQVLILLDFSETFDTMENSLLSETLISLGFCSPTHPLLLFLLLWQLLLLCVFQLFLTWKSESEAAQSCPTLCDPMDCSLPCSSVHGIFQAKVLEWGAMAFSIVIHKSFLFSDASVSLTVSLVITLTAQNLLECRINFFPLVLSFAEMENNRCLSYTDPSNLLDLYSLS